jgi:hypothetical protein
MCNAHVFLCARLSAALQGHQNLPLATLLALEAPSHGCTQQLSHHVLQCLLTSNETVLEQSLASAA